jgi:hypothetical protein
METTKTGRRLRIPLPAELMDILQWHVDTVSDGPMRESELRFRRCRAATGLPHA